MPRTPKPESTKLQTVRVEMHNHLHLTAEAGRLGLPWGYVFNQELEFARTAGLQPFLLALMEDKLRRNRSTLRDEFKAVIWEACMRLPKVPWPPEGKPPELDRTFHAGSINISGPNRFHVAMLAERSGKEFTTVLNEELRFARVFDLRPEFEERLAQHLKRTRMSAREWASMEMMEQALPLRRQAEDLGTPTAKIPARGGPKNK